MFCSRRSSRARIHRFSTVLRVHADIRRSPADWHWKSWSVQAKSGGGVSGMPIFITCLEADIFPKRDIMPGDVRCCGRESRCPASHNQSKVQVRSSVREVPNSFLREAPAHGNLFFASDVLRHSLLEAPDTLWDVSAACLRWWSASNFVWRGTLSRARAHLAPSLEGREPQRPRKQCWCTLVPLRSKF